MYRILSPPRKSYIKILESYRFLVCSTQTDGVESVPIRPRIRFVEDSARSAGARGLSASRPVHDGPGRRASRLIRGLTRPPVLIAHPARPRSRPATAGQDPRPGRPAAESGHSPTAVRAFLSDIDQARVARFGVIDRSIGEPRCSRRCRRTDARNPLPDQPQPESRIQPEGACRLRGRGWGSSWRTPPTSEPCRVLLRGQ
jgi:hypothetical protein